MARLIQSSAAGTPAMTADDSRAVMMEKIRTQLARSGYAMDPYFYRSHVVYEQELERILYRSWLYAGHVSQLPEAGSFFQFELGEDALLITRDQADNIHALMNICRHRGARVCEAAAGSLKTFVCPYHGWVYALDGSLKAARAMEMLENFDRAQYGLKTARCVVYEGMIFVNCAADAADFTPALDSIAATLRPYHLGDAKIAHRQLYAVNANWKLAVENYLECYHCATAHRAYARMHSLQDLDDRVGGLNADLLARCEELTGVPEIGASLYRAYGSSEAFGTDISSSRYALYDGFLTGSDGGQPVAPLMGEFKGYDGGAGDFQFGPLCFMLNYPDHCVLYRFTPRAINRTDMELVWLVRGDAREGEDYDRDALTWLWHNTTLEDEYIISRNSLGVNSRFFEPGPYHPGFEYLCADFDSWYLRALQAAAN